MARSLEGKVALVTGASSGVGWQTALDLAALGVKVCVTARRRAALELLRDEIVRRGGDCFVMPGDVTNDDDVGWIVASCIAHFGRIDVLVNNAAVQSYAHFEDYEWEEIQRVFDVGCFGYMRYARAVLPHFRAQKSGHIVNVLSMLSVGAAPLLSSYVATKHALLGWSDSLRIELSGTGIDISSVLVPSVATPMFDHAPTRLARAPKPIPPTYDVTVASRAIVRCVRRPRARHIPVFLQGSLLLWVDRWVPSFGRMVLARWGEQLQQRKELPAPGEEGNLFKPTFRGIGPRGSVPPTSRWKRWGAAAVIAAFGAGVLLAAASVRPARLSLRLG